MSMKKLLLMLVGAMICVNVAAQEEDMSQSETDSVSMEDLSRDIALLKNMLDKPKPQDYYVPWKGKQKSRGIYVYPVLDVSAAVLSQKGQNVETAKTNNNTSTSTGVGLEFGGTVVFVPGRVKGDSLRINDMGFAFSSGLLFSIVNSDRYGGIYNIFGKAGVEIGNQHMFGFGCDFLAGAGRLPGDIIFCDEDGNETENTMPYTKWAFVYGVQGWAKIGLHQVLKGVDLMTYIRLMRAVDSGSVSSSPQPHIEKFQNEGWSVGVLLRFRI